jgi:hypothetical protein
MNEEGGSSVKVAYGTLHIRFVDIGAGMEFCCMLNALFTCQALLDTLYAYCKEYGTTGYLEIKKTDTNHEDNNNQEDSRMDVSTRPLSILILNMVVEASRRIIADLDW